ncbi:laccase-14-like [Lolium rigidum]|uniref:laccase-14-like n=1 Tax=Lolium rigidum TaxID=89674 RepID=UPI001F5C1C60|nr:laccase-14-like [Lolium rigidum]
MNRQMSGRPYVLLALVGCCCLLGLPLADSAVVEHTFHVGNLTVNRLGQRQVITAVNGQFPGPKLEARDGDTVVVHVVNYSTYNITIHWHGVLQRLSGWADGPSMVSQCPIRTGGASYTYRFNITGQEGTLWWHAHVSFLRATVYGALLIRPGPDKPHYPFPTPHGEATLLFGEWWNASVVDVERQAMLTGGAPNNSVALTINGMTGGYELAVRHGKTYLLRLINAALNYQLFFKVAGHAFTVVAADACYTDPYDTDVVVLAPGQTVDALMYANATTGRYYMAAQVYQSLANATYTATTTALLRYEHDNSTAAATARRSLIMMPHMPAFNDSETAQGFYGSLTGLLPDGKPTVPLHVGTRMLVTYGLGVMPCMPAQTLCNRTRGSVAASMNNVSFQLPTTMSLLEAHATGNVDGVYTRDFPDRPPVVFNFTSASASSNRSVMLTSKGTKVKTLRFNTTVEVVLQNTAILGSENHPLHLHGFNFYVLAQGVGNFHARSPTRSSYNLVNPQQRNTVAVPAGGWAVIRFTADNPGVWVMHCHLDAHLPFGLAMAFEVDDGPTPDTVLPPPPPDYPQC